MLPPQAFFPPFDSELPVRSFFRRRHRRCQDTVPPVVEVWTGTSFSLSDVVSDFVSVPSLAPAITQCPLVAPGGRMRHPLLQTVSGPQSKSAAPSWVQSGLAAARAAYLEACFQNTAVLLGSVPQNSTGKPASAASASTEDPPHTSAPVPVLSEGLPVLQLLSPLEVSRTLQLLPSLEVSQTPQCQL
ncbi:hypothetical protein CHARACLAT_023942 [Characodon lateralis]|uniref:Uncharacterized protein n=1 Tax=Characodon lateralis TaxID=208331 RepID=A0ABU7E3F3_9TELE|nr:hypothetical protein [Characodon lateralis]